MVRPCRPAIVASSGRAAHAGSPSAGAQRRPLLVGGDGDRHPAVLVEVVVPVGGRRSCSAAPRRGRGCPSRSRRTPWAECSMTCSPATLSALATIGASTSRPSPVRRRCSSAAKQPDQRRAARRPGRTARTARPGACSGKPASHAMPDTCSIVMAKPVRSRHGRRQAERRHPHHDRRRVDGPDVVPRQPERLHHPWAVVLDDHVALGDQPVGQRPARRRPTCRS